MDLYYVLAMLRTQYEDSKNAHRFLIPVKFSKNQSTGKGGEDYSEVAETIDWVAQQTRRQLHLEIFSPSCGLNFDLLLILRMV